MEQTICKFCGQTVATNFFFCPYCGKKIIQPPITTAGIIGVIPISILLPPFGLWPGIKYLLQKDPKSKKIGVIAITLTILSTVVVTWLIISIVNSLTQNLSSQMNGLQNVGYSIFTPTPYSELVCLLGI